PCKLRGLHRPVPLPVEGVLPVGHCSRSLVTPYPIPSTKKMTGGSTAPRVRWRGLAQGLIGPGRIARGPAAGRPAGAVDGSQACRQAVASVLEGAGSQPRAGD